MWIFGTAFQSSNFVWPCKVKSHEDMWPIEGWYVIVWHIRLIKEQTLKLQVCRIAGQIVYFYVLYLLLFVERWIMFFEKKKKKTPQSMTSYHDHCSVSEEILLAQNLVCIGSSHIACTKSILSASKSWLCDAQHCCLCRAFQMRLLLKIPMFFFCSKFPWKIIHFFPSQKAKRSGSVSCISSSYTFVTLMNEHTLITAAGLQSPVKAPYGHRTKSS